MKREDVEAFLGRPWNELERMKEDYLIERLDRGGPTEGFRMADELRLSVMLVAEGAAWLERDEDFDNHIRLKQLLERAGATQHH
ncbi:MAG: hypothetical protein ACOZIN_10810 [Myxococcota bacterium]